MKNKTPKLCLFGIVSLLLFMQLRCKENAEKPPKTVMPEITQEGKNTIGCYVNGELYAVPSIVKLNEINSEYNNDYDVPNLKSLNINSGNGVKSNIEQHLNLFLIKNIIDTGMYSLTQEINSFSGKKTDKAYYSKFINRSKSQSYICPKNAYGWMHISKFDTISRIVSGTFEFDAVNKENADDKIEIRTGRFDIKIN